MNTYLSEFQVPVEVHMLKSEEHVTCMRIDEKLQEEEHADYIISYTASVESGAQADCPCYFADCTNQQQYDKDAYRQICKCCDKLRSTLLASDPTTASNLDALIDELGGLEDSFATTKDNFIEENYPRLGQEGQGMYSHPDIFISSQNSDKMGFRDNEAQTSNDKGDHNESRVYDFLTSEFKDKDCFMFHSFKNGFDKPVVAQLCKSLYEKSDPDNPDSIKEVEFKMKKISCYFKVGLVAVGLLSTSITFAHEIGLQMYSLRNQFAEDPAKSLDQIQDWGI